MNGVLFQVDGSYENVTPVKGDVFTLEELQTLVGGYIELGRRMQTTDGSVDFIVDEDGLLKGLQPNTLFPEWIGRVLVIPTKMWAPEDVAEGM